jgi:hypothetical protein
MNDETAPVPTSTIPGRWVVLGMLAFGIVMTSGIWVYSKIELEPFLPLAKALETEFPKTHPRVKGGRPKRQAPLLRIVMDVNFTPTETDPHVVQMVDRIIALAKQNADLKDYEKIQIHLVHYVPEKNAERITVERNVSDL